MKSTTKDGIPITLKTSASNCPPGHCDRRMIVGTAIWLKIGEDWYRWEYIGSRLHEALETAPLFTLDEFLELHDVDLYKFEDY